jgi:hypothetical protein
MYRETQQFKPEEILVYLRRSRSDDPSKTLEEVLDAQKAKLISWMEDNLDGIVPEENWYKEVVSGETIQDRTEFQKILKRIESPQFKAILCLECSRISRGDLEDCGRIIKLLRFTSTIVITPYRSYDLRDEFEREGFERELKNGNYYLEYTKKLMRRGKEYAYNMGGYVASVPPYGYDLARVQIGKRKLPTLKINEEKAKVVRMIFDWYVLEDIGPQRIANRLMEMGVKPTRNDIWSNICIRKMLRNYHYIGKVIYFSRKVDYVVQDQKITKKMVKVPDFEMKDGLHEPIVSEDIFYRAQAKHDKNPKVKYGVVMRNPLSSILYCECGHAMTFRYNGDTPRFECPYQRFCKNASINAYEMMDKIIAVLQKSMDDFTVDMCEKNDDAIKRQEEKIAFLEKKLKDLEYRELALWEKYTEESMPKAVFESLRSKYEAEKESTANALRVAVNEMPQKIDYEERTARFHDALEALKDDNLPIEKKNRLLRACIEKITYKREAAFRVPKEEQDKYKYYKRGWCQSVPEIDIDLKL